MKNNYLNSCIHSRYSFDIKSNNPNQPKEKNINMKRHHSVTVNCLYIDKENLNHLNFDYSDKKISFFNNNNQNNKTKYISFNEQLGSIKSIVRDKIKSNNNKSANSNKIIRIPSKSNINQINYINNNNNNNNSAIKVKTKDNFYKTYQLENNVNDINNNENNLLTKYKNEIACKDIEIDNLKKEIEFLKNKLIENNNNNNCC